jgi:hypothetical protein
MTNVQLVTFKGCQSTIDFRTQLEKLIEIQELDIELETILVPSPKKAGEMGLFGSPTILIDGVEYQQDRRGVEGFY